MINLEDLAHTQVSVRGAHWFNLICAGRAAEGLRAAWRHQLTEIQRELGFSHIRFHGLFHDEMMICRAGSDGKICYNFRYVDELFDFLLGIGLKPFVELGFMPTVIASGTQTLFWWQANVTPPRRMELWTDLIEYFFQHCIDRYGLDEVRSWPVEVWNEPCIVGEFWSGTQAEYFALYEATVRSIKAIDPMIAVGGPSSAFFTDGKAPWMDDFLDFVSCQDLPLDFVSAHPYPVWWEAGEFSESAKIWYRGPHATAQDLNSLKQTLRAKGFSDVRIHVTEWNSSFLCRDMVHDTAFKAPFIIANCLETEGLADSLGYWTFTDLFEEHGAGESLFHGGFGLLTENGLKKSAYWGYWFLKRLGHQVIASGEGYAIARDGEDFRVLLYNQVEYADGYFSTASEQPEDPYVAFKEGEERQVRIRLPRGNGKELVTMHSLTRAQHSMYDAWRCIGSPEYLSKAIFGSLERQCRPQMQVLHADNHELICSLVPFQVILLEIGPHDTDHYRPMAVNNMKEATR